MLHGMMTWAWAARYWAERLTGQVKFDFGLYKSSLLCLFVYEGHTFFWLILALFMNSYLTLSSVSYDKDLFMRYSHSSITNLMRQLLQNYSNIEKAPNLTQISLNPNLIIPPWSLMVWQWLTIMESMWYKYFVVYKVLV